MNKNTKNIIQYTFLISLIILTIYSLRTTLDMSILPHILKIINIKYILFGVLFIILYMIFEILVFKIMLKSLNIKQKKLDIKLAMMGFYYNLVTPFASGSQPMQIYLLTKNRVSISKSTALITNKTVVFQSVVTIYTIATVFLNKDLLNKEVSAVTLFIMAGLCMNVVTIVSGLLIVLNPKKVKVLSNKIIASLNKIKFINLKSNNINKFIDEYNRSIVGFIKHKNDLVKSIILTIIQITIYFSISYCIYKAFDLNKVSYITLLVLQNFLYMSVSPIPTPGNVGANEIAFISIFSNVFPKEFIGYAVFLYAILVYYIILLISGVFTIKTHYELNKKSNKQESNHKSKGINQV